MYISIYKTDSLCHTPETNTTLKINYISIKKINQLKKYLWGMLVGAFAPCSALSCLPPSYPFPPTF